MVCDLIHLDYLDASEDSLRARVVGLADEVDDETAVRALAH